MTTKFDMRQGARMKILYTAEAVVEGGRRGHGRSTDGRLQVDLSVPKEMEGDGGPGTNPEQLFALGYAACFQSAMLGVARSRKLDASESTITSRVGIGPTGRGGLELSAALDLHAEVVRLDPGEGAADHRRRQRQPGEEKGDGARDQRFRPPPHGAIVADRSLPCGWFQERAAGHGRQLFGIKGW